MIFTKNTRKKTRLFNWENNTTQYIIKIKSKNNSLIRIEYNIKNLLKKLNMLLHININHQLNKVTLNIKQDQEQLISIDNKHILIYKQELKKFLIGKLLPIIPVKLMSKDI